MANTAALNILMKAYKRARVKGAPPYGAYAKLNAVMRKILSRAEWSFMESAGNLATVAVYVTGTIAVTNGSADIVGTDTVWTTGMTGRKILIGTVEYTFTWSDGTNGTLDRVYEGTTDATSSYVIYQNVYSLPADFGELIVIRDMTNREPLTRWNVQQMEEYDDTPGASGTPTRFAFSGEDDNGYQQIRLWQAPGTVISYKILYKLAPTAIAGEASLLDTPAKYDDVVIHLLVAEFTQDPGDLALAERSLEWMVRDNVRDGREAVVKRGFGGGAAIGLGTEPRVGVGPG